MTPIANIDEIVRKENAKEPTDRTYQLSADEINIIVATIKAVRDGKYEKPASGIPAGDLSSSVQSWLELARSAVQDISGKQDVIADLNNIRSNAQRGATHAANGDVHVTAEQKRAWDAKQDAIEDLSTIRSGAVKGATALQKHQDISGKADVGHTHDDRYYTESEVNAKLSTKQDVIGNLASIVSNASAGKAASDALPGISKSIADEVARARDAENALSLIVSRCFDSATYNRANREIVFSHGSTPLVRMDVSAFVKDGMVSDLSVVGSNLVVTFNADSGKEPVNIPLSTIFNPENYYTRNEVDAAIDDETIKRQQGDSNLQNTVNSLGNDFFGHANNSDVHVTAEQKQAWDAKQNAIEDLSTIRSGAVKGGHLYYSTIHVADIPNGEITGALKTAFIALRTEAQAQNAKLVMLGGGDTDVVATIISYGSTFWMTFFFNGKHYYIEADSSNDTWTASIRELYSKPSSGIPKSDLTSNVTSSLDKADTAVQPADLANVATKEQAEQIEGRVSLLEEKIRLSIAFDMTDPTLSDKIDAEEQEYRDGRWWFRGEVKVDVPLAGDYMLRFFSTESEGDIRVGDNWYTTGGDVNATVHVTGTKVEFEAEKWLSMERLVVVEDNIIKVPTRLSELENDIIGVDFDEHSIIIVDNFN